MTLKRAIISYSNGIVTEPGYDVACYTTSDLVAATSVPAQAAQQGDVLLWAGFTKNIGFSNWPAMMAACAGHPNIKYAYVYDEMFWNLSAAVEIGLDEAAILTAAGQARAAGLKPVVTILAEVVLDVGFTLTTPNEYDVIALDLYPLLRAVPGLAGNYPLLYSNELSNLLYSAIQRLRTMGYTGEIWYIYQAFGMHSKSDAALTAAFDLQLGCLNECEAMGVTGIVPWGMFLGPTENAAEPDLFMGYGTVYESQLRYPQVVAPVTIDAHFAVANSGLNYVSGGQEGGGPSVQTLRIVAFKLGSNYNTVPTSYDTGLKGTTVYSGTPASFSFYDEQTVQINMEIPATAGPFTYGELGLYLPNDILFARFSYGVPQIKTAGASGSLANTLRISALMRIGAGSASFHLLPGTAQTVVELSHLSLVNTPYYYPENPFVLVHEPSDFQESVMLFRNESTLWNLVNYSRIGTAVITAAADNFHITATYFGSLTLPASNLGRFVVQFPGGYLRTITALSGNVATLAQLMDTTPQIGKNVAVYELNSAVHADLTAKVATLEATAAAANLYVGLTTGTGSAYLAATAVTTAPPSIFSVTFMQASLATPTFKFGTTGPYPLLQADGSAAPSGLLTVAETRTVIWTGTNFVVQDNTVSAATLQGGTWEAPGTIGSTTPNTISSKTLTVNSVPGTNRTLTLSSEPTFTTSYSNNHYYFGANAVGGVAVGVSNGVENFRIDAAGAVTLGGLPSAAAFRAIPGGSNGRWITATGDVATTGKPKLGTSGGAIDVTTSLEVSAGASTAADVAVSRVKLWTQAGLPAISWVDSTRAADSRVVEASYTGGSFSLVWRNDAYTVGNGAILSCSGTSAGATTLNMAYVGSVPAIQVSTVASQARYVIATGATSSNNPTLSPSAGRLAVNTALMKDTAYTYVDKGSSGTTGQALDLTAGNVQRIQVTGAFVMGIPTGWPPSGVVGAVWLKLDWTGTGAVTWTLGAATQQWVKADGTYSTTYAGSGVTLQTANGTSDWVLMWSTDAGATIYIKVMR